MRQKTPSFAPSAATQHTARTATGRSHAPNAEETHSLPTAKAGADLFGPVNDSAPLASAAEAEPASCDAEFEAFYARYPRKRSKGFARRVWTTARKKASFEEIMAGLERYKFDPNPLFQPHPGTWLNGERWNDIEPDLAADAWGLNAWLPTAGDLGWAREALEEILSGVGLDREWRGDLDTMGKWLADGYRPDSIALVCAEETTRQPVPRYLAWLDRSVRARAFRWNADKCEWIRQRR